VALGSFGSLDVGCSVLDVGCSGPECNSPPASLGVVWGHSGQTLEIFWHHRTPSNPRFRSATLIQLTPPATLAAGSSPCSCLGGAAPASGARNRRPRRVGESRAEPLRGVPSWRFLKVTGQGASHGARDGRGPFWMHDRMLRETPRCRINAALRFCSEHRIYAAAKSSIVHQSLSIESWRPCSARADGALPVVSGCSLGAHPVWIW
jgi:hypothetical protein